MLDRLRSRLARMIAPPGRSVRMYQAAKSNRLTPGFGTSDSSADAQRKTSFPLTSNVCRVFPSTTRTPDARRVVGLKITLCTTLNGRSVRLPVLRAAGSVALMLLK